MLLPLHLEASKPHVRGQILDTSTDLPLGKQPTSALPPSHILEMESKRVALGPKLLYQHRQTTEFLSKVFHAKDLPKRKEELQVTPLPPVLLALLKRSAFMTDSKAYILLRTFLLYTILPADVR